MRKRLIDPNPVDSETWLDLEQAAQVEISSEDPTYPIDFALTNHDAGWRAATSGEQVIRLLFDVPRGLQVIEVEFEEHRTARTQEFLLRWSPDGGRSYHDIVRQQFTFSPPGTTSEIERYTVTLSGVTAIELKIVPDINRGGATASLRSLRLAEGRL
jgi:hypothetical protein